jgi:hypothetical protein
MSSEAQASNSSRMRSRRLRILPLWVRRQRLDRVVQACAKRQAILLKPDYAEAYYNLGNVLVSRNQLDA